MHAALGFRRHQRMIRADVQEDSFHKPTGGGWVHGGQVENWHGTRESRFVMLPDGRRARFPNGDLMVDGVYARRVCPGYHYGRIHKEPNY